MGRLRCSKASRLRAAVSTAALLASCSSSSSDCPKGQIYYDGGLYGTGSCGAPAPSCSSWSVWIAPGSAGGTEPSLVFDRSVSPARADLKVGARMQAGLVSGRIEPPGCALSIRYEQYSFRSSEPAILRLTETVPTYSARFLAVAPGTARVLADGPTQDGRPAELSICVDPSTFDDKNCLRTPLVIRVVP